MQRLKDAAEMLFEPTGDLWKDYCAYCEIEDKPEREDLVDAIRVVEIKAPVAVAEGSMNPAPVASQAPSKVQTHIMARNLDYCLHKKDAAPLASAIPHCHTLTKIHFTGCGLTEHSLKLFVEAIYKSPSVVSVVMDFNPNGLFKDPTVSRKDRNEITVNPAQYRGQHLMTGKPPEELPDKKGSANAGKVERGKPGNADSKKIISAAAPEDVVMLPIPTGWHALLLTGIQQLSLRGDGITDRQLEPLCDLLAQNNDLLSLNLWGNCITSTGAVALAKSLRQNRRLTALNLGLNQLDDRAMEAFANVFLTMDVINDECSRMRCKALRLPQGTDVPIYPTYADLYAAVASAADTGEKKDKKASPAAKKGKQEGPVERGKGDFDRDCVRLDESRVRIPGNTSLWALSFAENPGITNKGAEAFVQVFRRREPVYDAANAMDFALPAPYCVPSLSIERIDVTHANLPPSAIASLQSALNDLSGYKAAGYSRAPTAQ